MKETKPAAEFLREIDVALRDKPRERVVMRELKVTEPVDLSGRQFPGGLYLEQVCFDDTVNLNNCRFNDSVVFKWCKFKQGINLANSRIYSRFTLETCELGLDTATAELAILAIDGARIDSDIELSDVQMRGRMSARRLRLRGDLSFSACRVEAKANGEIGAVDLTNSEILGNTKFEATPLPRPPPLEMTGKILGVRSHFKNNGSGPSVTMRHAKAGDVSLNYAWFKGNVDLVGLNCTGLLSTVGWYRLQPEEAATLQAVKARRDKTFGGANIEGALQIFNGQIGYIYLRGITVDFEFVMMDGSSGLTLIEDGIIADYKPNLFFVPSKIGNLLIIRWHCHDLMSICPREVTGVVNEWRMRGIYIWSSRIDRHLSLWPGREVSRIIWQHYRDPAAEPAVFYFADGENPLVPVTDKDPRRGWLNRWESRLRVQGTVKIEHCEFGGDVEATGIEVADANKRGGGRIELRHCKAAGHVLFSSPISFLADMPEDDRVRQLVARYFVVNKYMAQADKLAKARRQAIELAISQRGHSTPRATPLHAIWRWTLGRTRPSRSPPQSTAQPATPLLQEPILPPMCSCDGADMQWLSARSVDLSGLHICKDDAAQNQPGHLVLRYGKVHGSLFTYARLGKDEVRAIWRKVDEVVLTEQPPSNKDDLALLIASFGSAHIEAFGKFTLRDPPLSGPIETGANIAGALNLEHSEIDELKVSDASFLDPKPRSKASEEGIVLDYAKVHKLYVARGEPRQTGDRQHNGFPVPLSLLDLSADTWFLESGERGKPARGDIDRETTEATPYLDLLDNDPNFRMSSYLQIERALRNRGLEREARQIYIAGRYRDVRQHKLAIDPTTLDVAPGRPENQRHPPTWHARSQRPPTEQERADGNDQQQQADERKSAGLQSLRVWRPGDGRYHLARLFLLYQSAKKLWCKVRRRPYVQPERRPRYAIVFRIIRPRRERWAFVIGVLWSGSIVFFGIWLLLHPTILQLILFLILLIVAVTSFFILRDPLRVFGDRLYWSILDYGTSAARLAIVIVTLFLISLALVSGERRNFEPTLLAETAEAQNMTAEPDRIANGWPLGVERKWDGSRNPKEHFWTFGERLWITLQYHVPLASAIVSDDWQPADQPLRIALFAPTGKNPRWWPFHHWLRARDWFGIMLWANWLLWPLFLPYLIRKLSRNRGGS